MAHCGLLPDFLQDLVNVGVPTTVLASLESEQTHARVPASSSGRHRAQEQPIGPVRELLTFLTEVAQVAIERLRGRRARSPTLSLR